MMFFHKTYHFSSPNLHSLEVDQVQSAVVLELDSPLVKGCKFDGGHIWIESEGLEQGSTATFLIKLGICSNANDSAIHQAPFHVRAFHGMQIYKNLY